jgi:hypothetical protein
LTQAIDDANAFLVRGATTSEALRRLDITLTVPPATR